MLAHICMLLQSNWHNCFKKNSVVGNVHMITIARNYSFQMHLRVWKANQISFSVLNLLLDR